MEIDSWAGGSRERGRYRESGGVRRCAGVEVRREKRPLFSAFHCFVLYDYLLLVFYTLTVGFVACASRRGGRFCCDLDVT